MKLFAQKTIAAFIAISAFVPFAAADLEKFLPREKTLALAKIESVPALKNFSENDPLAKKFGQKIVAPFLGKFEAKFSSGENAEFSREWNEWKDVHAGEAVFAISGDASCIYIADCKKDFDLSAAEKWSKPENLSRVKIAGVPAHKIKSGKTFVYFSVVGGKMILCANADENSRVSKKTFSKILNAVKNEKASGFTDSSAFKRARERIGNAELWFYADGAAIASLAYEAAKKYDAKTAKKLEGEENVALASIFSVQMTPIVSALAPEAMDSFWMKISLDAKQDYASESSLAWNENRGIVTLFTSSLKNEIRKPALFADAPDVVSFGTSGFSLGKFLIATMNLARQATPLFGLVDMNIAQMKMTQQLDVLGALKSLDNGVSSCQFDVPADNALEKTVFVQDVSDEKIVLDSVEKTLKLLQLPALAKTKILGVPVYSFDAEFPVVFAFVDKKLCVSSPELLRRVIAQKKSPAPSVWENPNFKAAEKLLPAGGCSVSYSHLGKALAGSLDEIRTGLREQNPEAESALSEIELSAADFDYSVVSKSYLEANELNTKSRIIKNK